MPKVRKLVGCKMKKLICIALCLLLCSCSANKAPASSSEVSVSSSEQEGSSEISETVTYDSFDDFAMEAFTMENFCEIVSHDIRKTEDNSYQWVISIENVSDFDKLMVSAFIVGTGINPSMQEVTIPKADIKVTQAMISIDGENGAVIVLMPPITLDKFFVSTFVARNSYDKKDEIETAYNNSELSKYDMMKSLEKS